VFHMKDPKDISHLLKDYYGSAPSRLFLDMVESGHIVLRQKLARSLCETVLTGQVAQQLSQVMDQSMNQLGAQLEIQMGNQQVNLQLGAANLETQMLGAPNLKTWDQLSADEKQFAFQLGWSNQLANLQANQQQSALAQGWAGTIVSDPFGAMNAYQPTPPQQEAWDYHANRKQVAEGVQWNKRIWIDIAIGALFTACGMFFFHFIYALVAIPAFIIGFLLRDNKLKVPKLRVETLPEYKVRVETEKLTAEAMQELDQEFPVTLESEG
jgi:hypothetical protein